MSITFPLNGVKYSRVCGKIIGYQYGTPDAFYPYYLDQSRTIDSQYVDGVIASLMVKDQGNTFGHLQLPMIKPGQTSGSVHAPRPILPSREWSPHS